MGASVAWSLRADSGAADKGSVCFIECGGTCTINGFMSRVGSGMGLLREKPSSRASRRACADDTGPLSSNDWRLGGSVTGREGERGICGRPQDDGLTDGFSGLPGGVLNGDIRSSDVVFSGFSARVAPSREAKAAGFAGTFGFSARSMGGGNEELFCFRSGGLSPMKLPE